MTAGPNRTVQRILQISMLATAAYVGLTFAYGLRVHSLALLSESGHNVSDLLAMVLSFVALYFQGRPATEEKSFGYGRAGVLAAFVNALTLVVIAGWIGVEAIVRFARPVAVQPHVMMLVATAGVLMNGAIAALLWRFSGEVNIRSVFVHMLGDTLSTAAVIVGGLAISLTGQQWIDPLLSLIIAGMILWSSLGIVRETLHILLEGVPRGVALHEVRAAIQGVTGVVNVHDLHVWSVGPQALALVSHVQVAEMPLTRCSVLMETINTELRTRFHIRHTTLQMEVGDCVQDHSCSELLTPTAAHDHSHAGHSHSHFGHSH